MRVAFALALIVSTVFLPLQSVLAAPVSVELELLVGVALLNSHNVVSAEANHIVVRRADHDETIQSATVRVNAADPTTCTVVAVTGCPTPTEAVLSGCSDGKTYTITPGGVGVGTFTNGTTEGTVSQGSLSLTCQTFPPPAATSRP